MFKLSWFGKFLLAKTAIEAAGAYVDAKAQQQEKDDEFSDPEIQALAAAARSNDYVKFQQLYTFRRKWADANNVATAYAAVKRNL